MLNSKTNERELCYLVRINSILPIEGSDNCECAVVGGWQIMVRKNTFHPGDIAIYFEIDSHVDTSKPEFAFLEKKHGNIKTQKYTFGGKGKFISQGLLMHPSDFGWITNLDDVMEDNGESIANINDDTKFLTKKLGVTYAVVEDNKRKAKSGDKYTKMAQRHGKLFSHQPFRWLMKRNWGRKLLFVFYGKKKDTWPSWVVKTDEERVENMTYILNDKHPWIATEKIDGTSTTFTMIRKGLFSYDFYVCSRNVVFDRPNKNCYYDTNVYLEMAEKYNVMTVLKDILEKNPKTKWVTLQGETYGAGIQKRDYSLEGHDFAGFNLITSDAGRWNSIEAKNLMSTYNIPWVPILNINYTLPDSVEELRNYVNSETSKIDGKIKEGIVFRSLDGTRSFKCVSPEFLLEYHN